MHGETTLLTTPASDTVRHVDETAPDARRRKLAAYVAARTSEGFTVHLADTAHALQCRRATAGKSLQRAEQDGILVKLAGRDGWIATAPLAPAMTRVTLADLLDLARSRTTSTAIAHRGRRALHESHDIDCITPGQCADIERVVALILRHERFAAGDAARVGDGAFDWDARANGGRGGWALCAKVRAWAEDEHRAKHEARSVRSGGPSVVWTPRLALATVRDYAGAAGNLLHLAATGGMISRSPLAGGGAAGTLYAPCWVPVIERMVRWIGLHADAANPRRRYVGARTIAVIATQIGGRRVRSTDWCRVREAIERAREDGTIPRARYEAARYVWRAVVGALRTRFDVPATLDWPLPGDTRVSLVSAAAIRAAGLIDVAPANRDFSEWTTLDGMPATALVESEYGLRLFAAWSTVDALGLRLSASALPPRAWALESSVAPQRRKGKAPLQVSGTTLESRMRTIGRLAGFAARECGVDWRTGDLRVLVNPDLLERYALWTRTLPTDARGTRDHSLRDAIMTMAWIANGFLSSQAQRRGERVWVDTLGTWYHALETLASAITTAKHQNWQLVRASVIEIADTWRGYDGVDGLKKLSTVIACLEADLCLAAKGRTLDAQRAAILRGTWRPSITWSRTLRLMCVVVLAQRVPLRGNTMARTTVGMWTSTPVGRRQQEEAASQRLPMWEGALALDLPGHIMKSGRPFKPPLILPEHVSVDSSSGCSVRETGLRRDLWALWLMPGGGRDVCRTVRHPVTGVRELLDVPWLFPDPVRAAVLASGTARLAPVVAKKGPKRTGSAAAADGLWSRHKLSAAFKRAVIRHARALNIDINRLLATRAATGFHTIRRLFGTRWASSHLVWCSRLLDHTSVEMTLRIYVGIDERSMSLVVGAT